MRSKRNGRRKDGGTVAVAHGYGIRIRTGYNRFVVEDGFGRQRRNRRFRATDGLSRLVVIGRAGYVSFHATRWLKDAGVAYVHLDPNGSVISNVAADGADWPQLRRAQARAVDGPAGTEITRYLLARKVEGQLDVLRTMTGTETARTRLERCMIRLDGARDIDQLLELERAAAADYWDAWSPLPVKLVAESRRRSHIPEHWLTFTAGLRESPAARIERQIRAALY
jgi:CRISPR/Cas system-associated endonuclease Cas1